MKDGVVETSAGRVRGVETDGCWSFLGIRYAAPVSGANRFRPPQPVEPWNGIFFADTPSPIAPQPLSGIGSYLPGDPMEQGEDCLSLNIWSPAGGAEHLPVIVFLHGGAFLSGSGSGVLYRGAGFGRRGVVLVTVNYRLGFLGFLAHPELSSNGASMANRGLLDQLAALRWVEANIAGFGGDASNITFVGESAGAMSIADLLSSGHLGTSVRRVVLESGSTCISARSTAFSTAERFSASLGEPAPNLMAMESAPIQDLLAAQDRIIEEVGGAEGMPFRPIVDGEVLRVHPDVAIAAGATMGRELLVGTNRDEFRLFTFAQPTAAKLDDSGLERLLEGYLDAAGIVTSPASVVACYRTAREADGLGVRSRDLFEAIGTDLVFRVPMIRLLDAHHRGGGRAFCYRFDWESPFAQGALGACHALELPFVFGTLDNPIIGLFSGTGDQASAVSEEIQRAWVGFAATGVPLLSGRDWLAYEPSTRMTKILGGDVDFIRAPGEVERAFLDHAMPAYG